MRNPRFQTVRCLRPTVDTISGVGNSEVGCSPVLVGGSKRLFMKWIGRAIKQKRIAFPESDGPIHWRLRQLLFGVDENTQADSVPPLATNQLETMSGQAEA